MLHSKHKCPHLDRPSSTSVDVWQDVGRKRKVSHFYRASKNIFSFSFPVKYTPISDSLSTDVPRPHLLFRSHFLSFLSFQTALAELSYLFHLSTRNLLMSELTFKIFNRRWYSGNQQSEQTPSPARGNKPGRPCARLSYSASPPGCFGDLFLIALVGCCLCPPQTIHTLSPNPQGHGVRRWSLWGMMRSWGWSPQGGLVSS